MLTHIQTHTHAYAYRCTYTVIQALLLTPGDWLGDPGNVVYLSEHYCPLLQTDDINPTVQAAGKVDVMCVESLASTICSVRNFCRGLNKGPQKW
jgi:hypothetical protein